MKVGLSGSMKTDVIEFADRLDGNVIARDSRDSGRIE